MSIDEVLKILDIEINQQLLILNRKQLVSLVTNLAKNKTKEELSSLLSDEHHFNPESLLKAIKKSKKDVLFEVLNEPSEDKDLRNPVEYWLKDRGYEIAAKVRLPIGKKYGMLMFWAINQ